MIYLKFILKMYFILNIKTFKYIIKILTLDTMSNWRCEFYRSGFKIVIVNWFSSQIYSANFDLPIASFYIILL